MTDRISIPALRGALDDYTEGEEPVDRQDILALVEAVEAARRVADLSSLVRNSGHHEKLREALARFDFGEET